MSVKNRWWHDPFWVAGFIVIGANAVMVLAPWLLVVAWRLCCG
ncbi:hypothetical protein [Acidithiobacillus ferrooxidans]|nr:hypothetical protein [Acidithiobacillus ferrooxidans]MCR1344056.1 hypothetical protein [Acidithiobacillus ferrooxidans]